jgi:hypothetical protein
MLVSLFSQLFILSVLTFYMNKTWNHVFIPYGHIKDPQKQLSGPAIHGESVHHQPIGLHIAITAAAVMAGALGGVQAGTQSNQNGLHSQSALANDPLTLRLAKMSRSQLNEIMSELKVSISVKFISPFLDRFWIFISWFFIYYTCSNDR